ncbi:two-component response regulator ORR2-like [Oryza brachyantha]|uniref:two-component response regulator ORR2-like n=1 Tax=Oryza brachyantha TaxID=4533 RepID=UPI001ADAFDDE|nr:two-component response regulator ORR2-like [Oryza brachyantha]
MGAEAAVRVLVVDDSPVDRRVVELLLRAHCCGGGEAAPFHVTAVDSGKKAMELLGQRRNHLGPSSPAAAADGASEEAIDIVLTDYCMPEMTGYDLLKAIKALSSPNPIPVVVMSSENEPQRISRCLTAGAEDFILKPLKINDVQRLRKCSGVRPKGSAAAAAVAAADDDRCNTLSSSSTTTRKKMASDHTAKKVAATPEQQRSHLAGLAMVMNASSFEVSHYFQIIFKFILLAYAVLCLSHLLHRWSNGSLLSLWCA